MTWISTLAPPGSAEDPATALAGYGAANRSLYTSLNWAYSSRSVRNTVTLIASQPDGRFVAERIYTVPYARQIVAVLWYLLIFGLLCIAAGVSIWIRRNKAAVALETPAGPIPLASWRLRASALMMRFSPRSFGCTSSTLYFALSHPVAWSTTTIGELPVLRLAMRAGRPALKAVTSTVGNSGPNGMICAT